MQKKALILLGLGIVAFVAMAASENPVGKLSSYMLKVVESGLGKLSSKQKESVVAIVSAWARYGDGDIRKLVYILALAYHESRLQPIKEYKAAPGTVVWDEYQSKYWPSGFYGRGFVQLTWKENYAKMSKVVGLDLVANPDLALRIDVAAKIIVYGMMNGSFTGKKLSDYINAEKADYYNARRTVGAIMVAGKDTAAMIEGYATAIRSRMS